MPFESAAKYEKYPYNTRTRVYRRSSTLTASSCSQSGMGKSSVALVLVSHSYLHVVFLAAQIFFVYEFGAS